MSRIGENSGGNCKSVTYGELFEKWFRLYKLSVKDSTAISVKSMFNHYILPVLGDLYIDEISIDVVQNLVLNLYDKIKSYRNVKMQMSRVFDHGIRLEIIDRNPCKYIIMPKAKEYKEEKAKFWNKDELKLFLDLLKREQDYKWYVFFRLLAFTGMRKGEALALNWEDIDFENREIKINKTLSKNFTSNKYIDSPKTKSSKRILDIDIKTLTTLLKFKTREETLKKKSKKDNSHIIFKNGNQEYFHPSQPLKILNRMVKKHDLKPMTVHGFRHTHCSLLFEAGASIKEVQDRLGHSDIHTTMNIYTHVSKSKKIEVANKLATYLSF